MEEVEAPILLKDLGMRYPKEDSRLKVRYGLYKCGYCGKEYESILRKGKKSCGCFNPRIKHNLRKHRMYNTWENMMNRCYKAQTKQYCDYGGRGISVCEDWKDIRNFVYWVDNHSNWEEGLTLDRIDTNGDYSPTNCTFSTRVVQSINQRMQSNNTSGYVGACWDKSRDKWVARITIEYKEKHIGSFKTIEEAVQARDQYIIDNNLPHKLSKDYKEK